MKHISWVIERRHEDGVWEAVQSSFHYHWRCSLGDDDMQGAGPDPRMLFSEDARWFFEILSFSTSWRLDAGNVATPGHPDDTSAYAQAVFVSEHWTGRGHFTEKDLRDAAAGRVSGFTSVDQRILSSKQEMLKAILAAPRWMDQVMTGKPLDACGKATHPYLASESQHQRLSRAERALGLRPASDDTLRILVAYM
jgi:hypothetical protein